ncbi:hypothetical protein KI387_001607 [Taxus chinensis]|uniref:Chaperone DnaJ C-terminal domain-containing protein n=1 Tax=Taxus chinensis TaxID=29808 RepID=A0AA38GTL1_TAXCH|nr:hypothetical protein KI387_001607 [Taxus chinensis]
MTLILLQGDGPATVAGLPETVALHVRRSERNRKKLNHNIGTISVLHLNFLFLNHITAVKRVVLVLSDPQKRAIYDRYGEEGLKGDSAHTSRDGGGERARGGRHNVFRSYPGGAEDVYREFFGDTTISYPVENNPRSGEDVFAEYFGDAIHFGPRKGDPVENKLPCTLEQLYNGSTRKMKISRNILHISGKTMPIEEILTVEVKPGWKKGTKITFSDKGNEQPNVLAGDLIFVIDEKPHDVYKRDGNDLIVTQKITLAQALTGYTVNLVTLDGRSLSIPITDVISPGYEKIVPREGMPISKDQGMRGNLKIKFDIKYPSRLTSEQKAGVNRFIGG